MRKGKLHVSQLAFSCLVERYVLFFAHGAAYESIGLLSLLENYQLRIGTVFFVGAD